MKVGKQTDLTEEEGAQQEQMLCGDLHSRKRRRKRERGKEKEREIDSKC